MKKTVTLFAFLALFASSLLANTYNVSGDEYSAHNDGNRLYYQLKVNDGVFVFTFNTTSDDVVLNQTYILSDMDEDNSYFYSYYDYDSHTYTFASFVKTGTDMFSATVVVGNDTYIITIAPFQPKATVYLNINDLVSTRLKNEISYDGYFTLSGKSTNRDYYFAIAIYSSQIEGTYQKGNVYDSYIYRYSDSTYIYLKKFTSDATVSAGSTPGSYNATFHYIGTDSILYEITYSYRNPSPTTQITFTAANLTVSERFHDEYGYSRTFDFDASNGTYILHGTLYDAYSRDPYYGTTDDHFLEFTVYNATTRSAVATYYSGTLTFSKLTGGNISLTGTALCYGDIQFTFSVFGTSPAPTDTVAITINDKVSCRVNDYTSSSYGGSFNMNGYSADGHYGFSIGVRSSTGIAGIYTTDDYYFGSISRKNGNKYEYIGINSLYPNMVVTAGPTAGSYNATIHFLGNDLVLYEITFVYENPKPATQIQYVASDLLIEKNSNYSSYLQYNNQYKYDFTASNGTIVLYGTVTNTTDNAYGTFSVANENLTLNLYNIYTQNKIVNADLYSSSITIAPNGTLTGHILYYGDLQYNLSVGNGGATPPSFSSYDVTLISSDLNKGTVSGDSTYSANSYAVIYGNPRHGYLFDRWNDGNRNNPRIIQVNQDTTFIAYFVPDTFRVHASSNDLAMGTVTGSGNYPYLDVATVVATPASGYEFKRWNNGETSSVLSVSVECDTMLIAIFAPEGATGLEDNEESSFLVTSNGNQLMVSGVMGKSFSVYDAAGRLVATREDSNEYEIIQVDVAGVYFVRIGNSVLRTIVK